MFWLSEKRLETICIVIDTMQIKLNWTELMQSESIRPWWISTVWWSISFASELKEVNTAFFFFFFFFCLVLK